MERLLRTIVFLFYLSGSLLSLAQTSEGYLRAKDVTLFYKLFGTEGDPLLLINGGPGFSSNYLDEVATTLSQDYRVITFDQRGTGNSAVKSMTKDCVNIPNTLEDIYMLQDSLKIKRWSIIGHAYGGALAMKYAAKYPKRVEKLILSSSIGLTLDFVEPMMANLKLRLNARQEEELSEINQKIVEGKVDRSKFYKQRFDLVADAYVYNKAMVQAARDLHKEENDFVIEVNQIIWDELNRTNYDIRRDMERYKGDVLILHGRQDVIGESVPIVTHLVLEHSKLVFINKAGRYLWLDQPDDYFKHICTFLD